MLFKRGGHALERRFNASEKGVHIFQKEGFTFMKITLTLYYWRFTLLRRGLNIFGKGVHIYKNNIFNILLGVHFF